MPLVRKRLEDQMLKAFRAKWIIGIFICVLIINLSFWIALRHYEVEEFTDVGKTFTKGVDESLRLWMLQQVQLGKTLVNAPEIADKAIQKGRTKAKKDATKKWLSSVVNTTPQLENLEIYSFNKPNAPWQNVSSGEYALDSDYISARDVKGVPIEDSGAVEQLLTGSPYYISSIMATAEQSKPIFYLSIPIKKDGQILGILNMVVKLSSISEPLINSSTYEETGYMFLIDDRGETIAHKMNSYVLSDEVYLQDIVNKLLVSLNFGNSVFEAEFKGDLKLYYGVQASLDKSMIRNKWYIVFTEKQSEIHGVSNQFLMISMVVLMAMILLGIAFNRSIEQRLQEAIERHSADETHHNLLTALEEKKNEAMRQIALDPLTQLNHFQSIQKALTQEIEISKRLESQLTLVMFHVDAMGAYNFKYGHEMGDVILNHIGRLLRQHFPDEVEVGRVYGDVYAIILSGKTLIEAVVLIEQFKKYYESTPLELVNEKPSLGFGIVQWKGESSELLINEAERQLKKAKKQGANQIKY